MIKIITLANLQLFLTKCKTLFASKKHTHTASEITGLPSGGGADSTRYTVDENGYTVIKDKYGNDAFCANGANRELRDSKGNTAVLVKNQESLPNDLGGGVEINIYGDAISLGSGNSHIDVDADSFYFTDPNIDVRITGYSIPSLFPNRAIPNIRSLISNAIISVPDEELTYGYMYDYYEGICVFHNESHTMYFLKVGDVIQPLSIPVFNSVDEALVVLDTDTQLLYARNPNTGLFELMYNSGVSGSGFETVYLDENAQESVGYDKIVNITNAFLKLKELSEKI